jgi:hypothetical protein
MKFHLFILIIIVAFTHTILAQESKINIAVLDLDPTKVSNQDAQFLSDRLRTELFETDKFRVLERDKMENILEEQGFQMSGCTSLECAVEAGQLLNVQQMVAGNIGKIEEIYSISLRLIDVKTGAIIKTATRDYTGTLSGVLTEAIPSVAKQLSGVLIPLNKNPVRSQEKDKKDQTKTAPSKISFLIKGGIAGLNFTGDLNDAVDDFNATYADSFGVTAADKYPAFSNLGFEIHYDFKPRLTFKLGLAAENMTSEWSYDESNYINRFIDYQNLYLERKFSFVNIYVGVNYKFWTNPERFAFTLGADVGVINSTSEYYEEYRIDNTDYTAENTYTYSHLALKLSLGYQHYLGKHFLIGAEFVGQYISPYDASDEYSDFENYPTEFEDIMYPEEMNATGIQLNLLLGYRF